MSDDDLPVLTQVLRTGSGQAEASVPRPTEFLDDALDVRPVGETWMADQLVIGNEPHRRVDDYLMPSVDDAAATVRADGREADDASGRHDGDSFRLPQDHDASHASHEAGTFDEPHLHEVAEGRLEDPPRDAVPAEDTADLARRVRDAVLVDLRSRIDTELDARIAQTMHAEVESALAQLQGNLRAHLTDALRDVVQRAVDEEVARMVGQVRISGDA